MVWVGGFFVPWDVYGGIGGIETRQEKEKDALHRALSDYVLTVANQPTLGLHYSARHMRLRLAPALSAGIKTLTILSDATLAAGTEVKFATDFLRDRKSVV